MNLFRSLVLLGGRNIPAPDVPWDKGNSWHLPFGFDVNFNVSKVCYSDMYEDENLAIAIADVTFAVTNTGGNPL